MPEVKTFATSLRRSQATLLSSTLPGRRVARPKELTSLSGPSSTRVFPCRKAVSPTYPTLALIRSASSMVAWWQAADERVNCGNPCVRFGLCM